MVASTASTRSVSSGLGGGSLIYANVMLRKDEDWFVHEDRGRRRLRVLAGHAAPTSTRTTTASSGCSDVQKYPLDQRRTTRREDAGVQRAAEQLGLDWRLRRPRGDVRQPRRARSSASRSARRARTSTADAARPASWSASATSAATTAPKNSLDYTYLTAAWHAGADIRTRHEVREFEPREGGGYTVDYVEHTRGGRGPETDTRALDRAHGHRRPPRARRPARWAPRTCCCSNRAAFPGLSPVLGTRFWRQRRPADVRAPLPEDGPDGARCRASWTPPRARSSRARSASATRSTAAAPTGRGFYLEDAG